MAYSQSLTYQTLETVQLIEQAFRRCRVRPESITAEMLEIARDCLQMQLGSAINDNWPLWTQDRVLIPIYEGVSYATPPVGTLDMIDVNLVTSLRVEGEATSSAGGTADNAFDGDFATACTQVSTNGNLQVEFEDDQAITVVGILPNATGTWSWNLQRSEDGATWVTVQDVDAQAVVAGEWLWYNLEGYIGCPYFRMLMTDGSTLDIRELYLAYTSSEVPIYRMNIDQYSFMPDRNQRGRVTQYFFDRQIDPLLRMWPVPDYQSRMQYLAAWRRRYLMNVGEYNQSIEIPRQHYETFLWGLSWRLCQMTPEIDESKFPMLKATAEESWARVRMENRDRSPIQVQVNISPYTR